VGPLIASDYAKSPTKPTLIGECRYEDTTLGNGGWTDDSSIRRRAYQSLFAGGFGFTYGQTDIQVFWPQGTDGDYPHRYTWRQALGAPGASEMRHLRALVESRPMLGRTPHPELVLSDPGSGDEAVQAALGAGGGYAFVYLPTGADVQIDLSRFPSSTVAAAWFDPRTGALTSIGELPSAPRWFDPPGDPGPENDWVLVIDSR
jgi:hypothetical protein